MSGGRTIVCAQVGLVLLVFSAAAQTRPSPAVELREVCEQLRASDESYFGEAPAAEMTRRLSEPFADPADRASLELRLGRELLELGLVDVAVELGVTEPAGRSLTSWLFDHDNDGELGLETPVLIMGANHGDLDNDGFEDIYLGTAGSLRKPVRSAG